MRKWLGSVACAILLVGLTAACGARDEAGVNDATYNVGVLLDQTGVSGYQGVPTGAGIQAYVKMINDKGGVNGKRIELQVADGQSKPQGAQTALQQLLSSRPIAVLGFTGSSQMAAIPQLASSARIPFLMEISTDSQMLPKPQPWLFTTYMPTAKMMEIILAQLEQKLGTLKGKRLAVSAADTPFGDGFVQSFKDSATALGYTPALVDRAALQLTTFAPNAAKVVSSKADALIVLDLPSLTPQIVKDTIAAGFAGPILGYEQASDPAIIKAVASPQYSGFLGAAQPAPSGEMADAAKVAGIAEKMTTPNFSYGWSEGAILVKALTDCGASCDGAKLTDELERISGFTVPGDAMYGPISFSPANHYATSTAQFYTWDPATQNVVTAGKPVSLPKQ
ncbi:ABC transporter substrate-binding protein [Amycolatopsis sp. NPDC005232]|uniref:ABC transporter substrate-binding protein n=1 Tax=Amycolatopsis sp. NPDC005232 TaxID=3157027 RepID=UPI0033AA4AD8